jgi:hypothetical protein
MSTIYFDQSNVWGDLEVLAQVRKKDNNRLLCLVTRDAEVFDRETDNLCICKVYELGLSWCGRDTETAQEGWSTTKDLKEYIGANISYVGNLVSGITRTIGSFLKISDNDSCHIVEYLGEFLDNLEKLNLEEELKENKDCRNSLVKESEEKSTLKLKLFFDARKSLYRLEKEYDARRDINTAKNYRELADRISGFILNNENIFGAREELRDKFTEVKKEEELLIFSRCSRLYDSVENLAQSLSLPSNLIHAFVAKGL